MGKAVVEAVNENEGPVVLKLNIPQDLYNTYKELADGQDLTVAELMVHRLTRCVDHSSIRSLYFPTSQLVQLEDLLQKRPIGTSEQAMALIRSALTIRVGDFPPVPITAQQAKRLAMGAYGGKNVIDHVNSVVQKAVSAATGI